MEVKKISANEYKFIFTNSSHTIGNIQQKNLLNDPCVIFAGYTKNHPLENQMIITLITSEKNPRDVMNTTFTNDIKKIEDLRNIFTNNF